MPRKRKGPPGLRGRPTKWNPAVNLKHPPKTNNRVNTVLTNKNINKLILVDKIVCLFYIYFIIQLRDDIILSISYHVFCDDINHAYI